MSRIRYQPIQTVSQFQTFVANVLDLVKKSKASGIPVGILRKVFSKGMQAWNAGHRPGVAQHQWGMGRVNSFITGAGGARKADADLWTKAKAAKARKKKRKK